MYCKLSMHSDCTSNYFATNSRKSIEQNRRQTYQYKQQKNTNRSTSHTGENLPSKMANVTITILAIKL